jgi:hypothetical protein
MRSALDEVKEKTKKKTAAIKSLFDYGYIFVLQSIMEELNLDRYLEVLLPPSEVSMVRALAFNRIIRPTAMKNVDSWYEGTALALESPQINLTSQRLSEFLCRLGESKVPDRFMSQLSKEPAQKTPLFTILRACQVILSSSTFLSMGTTAMENHSRKSTCP